MSKPSSAVSPFARNLLLGLLLVAATAIGCSDDPVTPSGGTASDAGQDANLVDGGGQDTTAADATGGDTGTTDASPTDTAKTDAGETDAGQTDTGNTDTGNTDGGNADAGDDGGSDTGPSCPGAAGCACTKDAECTDKLCAPGPSGEGFCAQPCTADGDCGAANICRKPPGEDAKFCIPDGITADAPCLESAWCAAGMTNGSCASYGHEGGYCRPTCTTEDDCAKDESCTAGDDLEGKAIKFCKGDLPACSPFALAVEATTTCWNDGKPGCTSSRACAKGKDDKPVLQPCTPAAAVTEVCDGTDGDCDGNADSSALCDDANPCTNDVCKGNGGCENTANTAKCDDSNACTKDDVCDAKACKGAAVKCDDANACTDDACDMATGCTATANTAKCDDANACTQDDACAAMLCGGVTVVCDDKDPCTDDSCDAAKGCAHKNNTGPCNDDNACTDKDSCVVGLCAGATLSCDDSNGCTNDSCDAKTGCAHAANTAPCNDGNACTKDDVCAVSLCAGVTMVCADDNPCTDDGCDNVTGCTHANNSAVCDDKNACTDKDGCAVGLCKGTTAVNCDDANACTLDSCDMAAGCTTTNATIACDDGDACTEKETCDGAGACKAGTPVDCEDGNVCTDDPCDAKSGCAAKQNNTAKCDDGQACTENDACDGAGKCVAGAALCGGACDKCDNGKKCAGDTDCKSGNCDTETCLAKPINGPNSLLVNEVDYDQSGADDAEFVELYNPATAVMPLKFWTVEHVNGNGGSVIWTVPLTDSGVATIPGGGYLVICVKAVCDALPIGVAHIEIPAALQNGAPDGVRVMYDGKRIDGVAYEGTMDGVGEGAAGPTDDGDGSIARCPNGANTDDNAADFKRTLVSTPGLLNVCASGI